MQWSQARMCVQCTLRQSHIQGGVLLAVGPAAGVSWRAMNACSLVWMRWSLGLPTAPANLQLRKTGATRFTRSIDTVLRAAT